MKHKLTKPGPLCPYCKAPNKYPKNAEFGDYFGFPRARPVTYTCGTTASQDWAPPVQGEECEERERKVV